MEQFANKIALSIRNNKPDMSEEDFLTTRFGLECILNETIKTIIFLVIFSWLSVTKYFLVSLIYFILLRSIAGGFHADSFWSCFITSAITMTICISVGCFFPLPVFIRYILFIISFSLIIIYAPVDHPNKPIISPIRRKRYKYLSILNISILFALSFILEAHLASTAVVALFLEAFSLPAGMLTKRS